MRTEKDVEAYLLRHGRPFDTAERADHPTYLVAPGEGMPQIAVRVAAPLIVVRVHIGDVTDADEQTLFRRLLELNAGSLVHSSYGIEGNRIVLTAAAELQNLDFNEVEAILDEIELALAQQVPELLQVSSQKERS